MKHTPGPWFYPDFEKGNDVWCKDHPIAEIIEGKWGDDYPAMRIVGPHIDMKVETYMDQITYGEIPLEEANANARLIAAAPDLLEACQQAYDDLLPYEETDLPGGYAVMETVEKLRAAIAKAEESE